MAAGGTAGHLVPALAIADALRARDAEVSFVGTGRGLEKELVPAAGYPLDLADLRGLRRRPSLQTILFIWSLLKGTIDCARILRRRRADVVVGVGGYVSWAPVFMGVLTRRPTMIVELDSHMGLANRALAPLARRVILCFPIPGRTGQKYLRACRPLSRQLLQATPEAGRAEFGLKGGVPVVLAYGGSQGARSINEALVEAFGRGKLDFQLVHVSGKRDYEQLDGRLKQQGADPENYHLLDYTGKLPLAMAAADLVLSRSGASVQELAALGKPAILVPYPYATADHQLHNAEWMAAAGAARVIADGDLDAGVLRRAMAELLTDRERLARMAAASAGLADQDGAGRIADEIFEITHR